ncbi:hypothetical protein [Aromatoleum aromaticum]|uniref:hypothetical protein n=1 Tax=Aromatoleum aromaticum TaxID=551760 RepID=UPI001459E1B2|nr:hypothetical protein [Aromatoleum aromaticum]NMG56758.1 hypothetical protein [Aromatoleum aromaticum]
MHPDHDPAHQALEAAIDGIGQALGILAGLIAEQTGPVAALQHLLHAEMDAARQFGANAWRDRALGRAVAATAEHARAHADGDPALQRLIAAVLAPAADDARI